MNKKLLYLGLLVVGIREIGFGIVSSQECAFCGGVPCCDKNQYCDNNVCVNGHPKK